MRLLSLSPLLALAFYACNGPCESLADKICSCRPNQSEEQGCLQDVKTAMSHFSPTTSEDEFCDQKLDTCDCEALEAEQYDLCGLTKEPGQ